jgi:DNA topoisomerase-1
MCTRFMTSLVIVESPAKCSKIQGFLGPGWRVIASMGHIRALEEDLDAVGLDRDFEARYTFLKDKAKTIQQLKEAAAAASTIYLASDDDREGEAISYSVAVLLKLPVNTTPRIIFHEITKPAILAAVAKPRLIDMNRVNAQQARAVLDMMVGFTISPLLWKFVGSGLSAGRCQTPALRIIAERDTEIGQFTAETSWTIQGKWSAPQGHFDATMVDALDDEESASNYLENIHAESEGVVRSATTRPTSESPPKPLITSTLQQEASALYGSQPKNTMRIAQRLYEQGYITYMRTDHPILSEEARVGATDWVRAAFGDAYCAPAATKKVKTKSDTTAQEAHEAIRPTHIDCVDLPPHEDWSAADRKLYKLIWNRTMQSVMSACKGEECQVRFVATGDPGEFEWLAVWKRTTFYGWKKIGQAIADLDGDETSQTMPTGAWTLGQSLQEGATIKWSTLEALPTQTKALPRYTEATLVRELEKRGIGRPSTFASLVGTILDKGYVEKRDTEAREVEVKRLRLDRVGQWPATTELLKKRVGGEKQKLAATALGQSALDFCLKEFATLFDYSFTKQMEDRLDRVAQGEEEWKEVCRHTWRSYEPAYTVLKTSTPATVSSTRQTLFSGGIKAVQSKKGPILLKEGATKDDTVFYGWPQGLAFTAMTEEIAAQFVSTKQKEKEAETIGEYEGAPMIRQTGPFGPYVVCGGVNIPWTAGDTAASIREKLKAKSESVLHRIGPFEFRRGQYGVYMFKTDITGKGRKFVGVPSGLDPKVLTQEAATKIYQTGLQQKAKQKAYGAAGAAGAKAKAAGAAKNKPSQ